MLLTHLWTNVTQPVVRIVRGERDEDLLAPIRMAWLQLAGLSPTELCERCQWTRMVVDQEGADSSRARIHAFALMAEALRRAREIELYDVQLLGALVLARGQIAEMQTGEGKTFSCAPAALLHCLTGRGVHVTTPNSYLAQRDFELLLPAYRLLGVCAGLLPEKGAAEKRAAYRCDVTYGTGHEFGFDYLRDQLVLRAAASQDLGASLLQDLTGGETLSQRLMQRGLYCMIVDEADNVLLDDAASPLILSDAVDSEAVDAAVHLAALRMVDELRVEEHFQVDANGSVRLTQEGVAWIHQTQHELPIHLLHRTWSEYVQQALHARLLRRDVHYIVDDQGTVQIVDTSTGRIFTDRSWRDGLHQAVEAKERVVITGERRPLAQITRQRFARLYERLAGTTGTATGCEREFQQVYRLEVQSIPLRTPSQRAIWPARFFTRQQTKWDAIAASVNELHARQRPVLVGTRSIADSECLAELFRQQGIEFELLNGRQDAEEAAIVGQAGLRGAVTIATSLAGRGTDIKLGTGVADLGGLHVVVCECDESERIDRQLIGRCARQGEPGSAQIFVSAEDSLVAQHGSWLAQSIARLAGPDGELRLDLLPKIRRIQRAAERRANAARAALLRRDLSRDSLHSRRSLDS